jgi:hypothetical protein
LRLFPYPPHIVVDEKDRIVRAVNIYRAAKLARLSVIPVLRVTRLAVKKARRSTKSPRILPAGGVKGARPMPAGLE